MKTRHIQRIALSTALLAGAFLGLQSCDRGSAPVKLSAPKLPAVVYEYLNVKLPGGGLFDVKAKMSELAFGFSNIDPRNTGGFAPNTLNAELVESINAINNNSVQLGRVLFYDPRLSINNTVACASCHNQALSFTDNQAVSTGFGGRKTTRNAMALATPVLHSNMFWDSRVRGTLELSLVPVFNHVEMGMEDGAMLIQKLNQTEFYKALFKAAYGDETITQKRVALALSHFMNAMVSRNSKFDQVMATDANGKPNPQAQFSALEKMGHDLFFSERLRCSKCHNGENFAAPDLPTQNDDPGPYGNPTPDNPNASAGTANIGLNITTGDAGRMDGKFRIPTLRNIELTGPYMHDGRFQSLDEVLNHYSGGIQNHPSLDENLKGADGKALKMNLTQIEKDALKAFLFTLTDYTFISDPKFSNPFAN
ncbi:MAG: cytochrome-c peroxidase [Bacteroidia bacterium]